MFEIGGYCLPAPRRASVAHGEHEKRTGGQRDENWLDWYAEYMVAEQSGEELPQVGRASQVAHAATVFVRDLRR